MQLRGIKKTTLQNIGNIFAGFLVNILCKTLTIEEKNRSCIDDLVKDKKNFVFVFWHGTMIVPWYLMRNNKLSTIISNSKDGEILARILVKWDYNVKRGSSSKGGKKVLEDLIEDAKNGYSIAITPDGPKGPEKEMKAGATIIAKKAGIPLILAGITYKQRIKLKSWDKFEVPMFFSKAWINYSAPISVDKNLSYEETDKIITELGIKLNALQRESEQCC